MEKLGINIPVLLAQLVNFTILLILLYLFAYKPLLRTLDNRSARIKESMDMAQKIKEQAARTEVEVKAQLDAARQEGQAMIAQASQVGERVKEEAKQGARQEAQAVMVRAKAEMDREREKVVDELRKEFADIAILAAGKVIKESLDKKVHERLIQEVLEQSSLKKK
ncbi:MAG: synthase subunit [Dehalococcoidia bacterium]|nr:synthase subunit [Dehalococcoidia bacterium]